VNVFAKRDFELHFNVVSSGNFANGEWSWVLIESKHIKDHSHSNELISDTYRGGSYQSKLQVEFGLLAQCREKAIDRVRQLSAIGDFGIWGSAGKGIVLASTLMQNQVTNFIAIDADKKRWGKFLECSGAAVYSGVDALKRLDLGANVIVSNPNHMTDIQEYVQDRVSLIRL
jgi:hypothetical protein